MGAEILNKFIRERIEEGDWDQIIEIVRDYRYDGFVYLATWLKIFGKLTPSAMARKGVSNNFVSKYCQIARDQNPDNHYDLFCALNMMNQTRGYTYMGFKNNCIIYEVRPEFKEFFNNIEFPEEKNAHIIDEINKIKYKADNLQAQFPTFYSYNQQDPSVSKKAKKLAIYELNRKFGIGLSNIKMGVSLGENLDQFLKSKNLDSTNHISYRIVRNNFNYLEIPKIDKEKFYELMYKLEEKGEFKEDYVLSENEKYELINNQ